MDTVLELDMPIVIAPVDAPPQIEKPPTQDEIYAAFGRSYKHSGLPKDKMPTTLSPQELIFDNEHTGAKNYFKLAEGYDMTILLNSLNLLKAAGTLSPEAAADLSILEKQCKPYNEIGNRGQMDEFMVARI